MAPMRGTAVRGHSDVDVIAEFDPGRSLSLLDMVAIENLLADRISSGLLFPYILATVSTLALTLVVRMRAFAPSGILPTYKLNTSSSR